MEVMNREAAKLGLQVLFHEILGPPMDFHLVPGSMVRSWEKSGKIVGPDMGI